MRTYQPKATMTLPVSWAEAIAKEYVDLGYKAEVRVISQNVTEASVTIYGLAQRELLQHVNDPLGKPGEKSTIGPTTQRRLRKHKPIDAHTQALIEEEHRYLRPD